LPDRSPRNHLQIHGNDWTLPAASALVARISAKPVLVLSGIARAGNRQYASGEENTADVIYFDIDFQDGNAPFTINREYFPTFEKMIADFARKACTRF